MNVGYIFDEGFTIPAAVSIYSLLYNNKKIYEINLFIFDDGIDDNSKLKLNKMINNFGRKVTFIDVNLVKEYLSKTTSYNWNGSYATYIRLMLNTLLPDFDDRIIMIDGDTIINGNISKLASFDLKGNPIATTLEAIPYCYHKYSGLGDNILINGGLLVIDLKKWKECMAEEHILNYLKNVRENNMLTDEDVISELFKRRIKIIPVKYNYLTQYYLFSTPFYYKFFGWDKLFNKGLFYSLKELSNARKEAVIFHCIDTFTNRPWQKNCIHPYRKLFDKYLNKTPWSDYEKKNVQLKFRNNIEYQLRKFLPKNLSKYMYALAVKVYYGIGAKRFYS